MPNVRSAVACSLVVAATLASTAAFAAEEAPTSPPASPALGGGPNPAPTSTLPSAASETESHPLSIMLIAAYGISDYLQPGVGGRIGYTLGRKLYVGGTFMYHFGQNYGLTLGDGSRIEDKRKAWYLGPEVGIDLDFDTIVLRPYVGLGYAHTEHDQTFTGNIAGDYQNVDESKGHFGVWPGITLMDTLRSAFIGLDVRYVIINSDASGLAIAGVAGVRF